MSEEEKRELNDLIAVRVMGWHKHTDKMGYSHWLEADNKFRAYAAFYSDTDDPWSPSTDISDAWQVVEEMRRREYLYSIMLEPEQIVAVAFYNAEDCQSEAESSRVTEAICLAALAACEAVKHGK